MQVQLVRCAFMCYTVCYKHFVHDTHVQVTYVGFHVRVTRILCIVFMLASCMVQGVRQELYFVCSWEVMYYEKD